jgi:signal transduction histidine kinase
LGGDPSGARAISKLPMKLQDIQEECRLALMTVNTVSVAGDSIEQYEFTKVMIFGEVIARIVAFLRPKALVDRGIRIWYEIPDIIPSLYVDKHRIMLVFQNLLLNAIKYSYSKEKNSKAGDILIRGGLSSDKNYYTISVSNYGIKIPEERAEDIFRSGYRMPEAIALVPSGTGFGLAIVRQIVELHGGRVSITKNYDPTEITVFLPSILASQPPAWQAK